MYVCCPSGMADMEAKTHCETIDYIYLSETCTYMVESCLCGHHMSKDFCIPMINEVCSDSEEGKFDGRTHAQENFNCCSLFLWTGTITATVRDRSVFQRLMYSRVDLKITSHTFSYGRLFAEAGAVIAKSTLMQGNISFLFKYCNNAIFQL